MSFNKFTSSPIKNVIPPPIKEQFSCNHLYKFDLQLQSFLLYHFYNFSLYVHTCQLQHGKSIEWLKFKPANSVFFPPLSTIWKNLLHLMLVLIFFPVPFYFRLYKLSSDPTSVVISWLVGLSDIMDFKLNQMKLLI